MYSFGASIKGTSPLLYGGFIKTQRAGETAEDHEFNTWRERAHTDKEGYLEFPCYALKATMVDIAAYLGEKIPGQGSKRYKGKLESGLRHPGTNLPLLDLDGNRVHIDDIDGLWAMVPSDGVKGGGKRVRKCFPKVDEWSLNVNYWVVDEIITPELMTKYLSLAGQFKGLGTWRPGRGGEYGSFVLDYDSVEVKQVDL